MQRIAKSILTVTAVTLVVLGTAVVSGCGGSSSTDSTAGMLGYADYPSSASPAELVNTVDVVIVGSVVAAETRDINLTPEASEPLVLPYLVSSVEVQKVIKGDLAVGDVIEVKELLSTGGAETPALKGRGTRGVMFLQAFPGYPYSPFNPWQGVLLVEDGKTKAANGNNLFKTPKSEKDVVKELEGFVE